MVKFGKAQISFFDLCRTAVAPIRQLQKLVALLQAAADPKSGAEGSRQEEQEPAMPEVTWRNQEVENATHFQHITVGLESKGPVTEFIFMEKANSFFSGGIYPVKHNV